MVSGCVSQYVLYLYLFIVEEDSCDKETYRALELGVRYDYNNEIESNRSDMKVRPREIPAVEKMINLKLNFYSWPDEFIFRSTVWPSLCD